MPFCHKNLILKKLYQTVKQIRPMELKVEKHFISINADQDPQQPKHHLSNSSKKQKFTILVGSHNKYSGRLSIKNNGNMKSLQTISKRTITASDNREQKYYFLRKNQRTKSNYQESLLSQRKCTNLVSASLRKCRQNSKSYRVHTIDHTYEEQKNKKLTEVQRNHERSLNDITNKGHKFGEKLKNTKRKNLMHEDLEDFTTALKSKRQKDEVTINLKHRKFIKARTQFEEIQCEQEKYSQNKIEAQEQKKIDFKKSKTKNINTHQKKQTIQMKQVKNLTIQKYDYAQESQNAMQREDMSSEKNSKSNHKIFNNYLDYINRKKKQSKISKSNRNLPEDRSLIAKTALMKNSRPINSIKQSSVDETHEEFKKEKLIEETPKVKKEFPNIILTSREKQNEIKRVGQNQFDCSSIALGNQSSFLSEDGKKEIIITSNFKEEQLKKCKIIQNLLDEMKQNSPKKKKRKRESKMSILCRSQLKQVFPDRFFI